MIKRQNGILTIGMLLLDGCCSVAAFILAYKFRLTNFFINMNLMASMDDYIWLMWTSLPILWLVHYYAGLYEKRWNLELHSILFRVAISQIVISVILGTLIFIFQAKTYSRALFILYLISFFALLLLQRLISCWVLTNFRRRGSPKRNILFFGVNAKAARLLELIENNPDWRLCVKGILGDRTVLKELASNTKVAYLGDYGALLDALKNDIIDDVIFCTDKADFQLLEMNLRICEELGIRAHVPADVFGLLIAKAQLGYIEKIPILTFTTTPSKDFHLALKRLLDLSISFFLVVILCIPMAILSVFIKLNSPGSIFFSQQRIGLNGRKFRLLKFRSMVMDAEKQKVNILNLNEMSGPVFKSSRDPRITKIGRFLRRFSLDELPQLLNIILGDMSLVGPRPALPEEVAKYEPWQRRRLSMKPGLTCIWQISGRNEIDFNSWMHLDLQYIDHWSLALDMRILFKTLPVVLSGRGAS